MHVSTDRAGAPPNLLHLLFKDSATRWPDALALATPRVAMTYAELDDISDRVAAEVHRRGVEPDDIVAIAAPKGWEQVAAVLGVLKAGAAYLPVDPELPPARFEELLERAGCRLLLTRPGALAGRSLRQWPEVVEVCADLRSDGSDPVAHPGCRPDHLAYVLFTSGSTGTPKGVMIEHAGVVNTVRDLNERFALGPGDRFLGLSSLSFDMSVYDMFGAFGAGGALVLPDPEDVRNPAAWVELMRRFDVTLWNTVPMLLTMLVSWMEETGCRSAGALRLAFLGGDWIPLDLPARARTLFRDLQIVNIGGATEASICSCFFVVDQVDPSWSNVPYGKPLSGQYWRILRPDLSECRAGETGELYIGGVGVGRGYLNDPQRTAESFIIHLHTGQRLYRTGDLGRWMPDGDIEFLGRRDHQVKVRGHRIELGEIEAHAQAYPGVRQAVAVAVGAGAQLDRIVLFIVGTPPDQPDVVQVREFLRARLPRYMVPDRCCVDDALPLTSNGKIDRAGLADRARTLAGTGAPEASQACTASVGAASGARGGVIEDRVAQLWHDLLGEVAVGREADFFEAGGNSLLATTLAGRIRRSFGVAVSPAFVFGHPSITRMAAALDGIDDSDLDQSQTTAAEPALTFGQEQLWYFDKLAGAGRAYQFQASIRLQGDLNVPLLQRSLSAVVARHETLRTTYTDTGAGPRAVVHSPYDVELVVEDLRTVLPTQRDEALREAMDREIARTFDLSRLPLIRWRLYRTGEHDWTLTEVEHHIVHDGWSVALLWREVEAMYTAWLRGDEPVLPELGQQLGDLAVQQRRDHQQRSQQLERYWTRQLDGVSPLELPIARRRPPHQTFEGATRRVVLHPELYRALRRVAREQGCSLYALMLAAYKLLLHRYTGESDISVGSWMANRLRPEAEPLIGMLVNMVVLRDRLDDDDTIVTFLAQVARTAIEAFDHQDAPFHEVVRAVNPRRDPSRNPLVQVCFSFHDSPVPEVTWPGVQGILTEEHNRSAKFDLNLVVVPHAEQRRRDEPRPGVDHLVVVWEYNTDLFDPADVDRMIGHYEQVLRAVVADPHTPVRKIDLRTEVERQEAAARQGPRVGYPAATVPALVLAKAESTPDAVAVSCGDQSVSYRDLAAKVRSYTAALQASGISRGDLVAVCLNRSPDLVACLLAVMAAGAAYVPLDPTHPTARHHLITGTADIRAVVHDGPPERFADAVRLVLTPEQLRAGELAATVGPRAAPTGDGGAGGGRFAITASPDDRAYVMFTSGSTGLPKGVEVAHRSVVNLLWDMRQRLHMSPHDVVAAVTTVAFDISVLELFGVLAVGGRVDVIPEDMVARPNALLDRLHAVGATILQATPTMWRLLTESGMSPPTARFVALSGGETCPPDLAGRIVQVSSEAWNVYGPTETTIWSTAHRLTATDTTGDRVPIGHPLANTSCTVLSPHGAPQPTGIPGELYIGGDGVALGYLGRDELTAQRFVTPAPASGTTGRHFATGDVARWNRDGVLEFLGRNDAQVKLRGHRIELGEVETALCNHPKVRNAAVVWEPGGPEREPFLSAYVAADVDDADGLRRHLREHLPAYMEPARIARVDALPINASGKVDRRALSTLHATELRAAVSAVDAPAPAPAPAPTDGDDNEVERVLSTLFAEVLGVAQVDPYEDFFELGGHSLLALRLAHRVRETLSVDIGLELIFDHGSVKELAEVVGR
jgi:amino acid adenylation domain-containing protein